MAGSDPKAHLHAEGSGAAQGHSNEAGGHGHGVPAGRGFVEGASNNPWVVSELRAGEGKGQVLFFDCQSGIAGDMTLAALVDLGVPLHIIEEAVDAVGLSADAKLVLRRGFSGAIGSAHLEVEVAAGQPERTYSEIRGLLDGSRLAPQVKALAQRMFERLARAEAEVHRSELDQVHFHEVGAVDAIVDIVGSAAALSHLGAKVLSSPLPLGRGHVHCRHGVLPLPAPAALLCLRGVPTVPVDLTAELVTPTGAAILAEVAEGFVTWPRMTVGRVGWGAGTRGLPDRPNVLRAVLGTPHQGDLSIAESRRPGESRDTPTHVELRANLDDLSGELAAHALRRLLDEGALDAWIVPVTMKKGRPGIILCALSDTESVSRLSRVFFEETTTLGVRKIPVSRDVIERHMVPVETRFGAVPVKLAEGGKLKPEFDACVAIAEREGLPLWVVLREVEAQGRFKV